MRWQSIRGGLRVQTPAKLNLYLEVGPKRSDGFHEIDSIFQAVTLFDELEFHPTDDGQILLEEEGIACGEDNLVCGAARLLKEHYGDETRGARILLKKRIPMGAGLGGGSSDAAATLVALDRLWGSKASDETLRRIAAEVGSDVPFFLTGGVARCQGRGENVTSLNADFDVREPLCFVLAYPRVEVATGSVYKRLDDSRPIGFTLTVSALLDSISSSSIRDQLGCGKLCFNRLEGVVFAAFAELQSLRATMWEEPFLNVLLSGSGSTVFGICRDADEAERIAEALSARLQGVEVFAVRGERQGAGPPTS